jgi:hypothetical protein
MHPTPCLFGFGKTFNIAASCPESKGTVSYGKHRSFESTSGEINQDISPGVLRLSIAWFYRQKLLITVDSGSYDDKKAEFFVLSQADVDVHSIGPDVNVLFGNGTFLLILTGL